MSENDRQIRLSIPAKRENALVARMAMSAVALMAGLDVDTIGDLRTVTGECVDCLLNQPARPARIDMSVWTEEKRLFCSFEAIERYDAKKSSDAAADAVKKGGGAAAGDVAATEPLNLTITQGVLETLMPEVSIQSDEGGVKRILCSMPL